MLQQIPAFPEMAEKASFEHYFYMCRNHAQKTPLLHAISKSAMKQAQALVECGASIMATDANGETVLHLAASSSSWCPSMMGWLVENGADVNWVGGKPSETTIFYSIRNFYNRQGIEYVRNLLLLGADVQFRNIDGLTPVSLAVRMGSTESTKILLEHGSCPNSRDKNGKSPLHYAAEARNVHKIVELRCFGFTTKETELLNRAVRIVYILTASYFAGRYNQRSLCVAISLVCGLFGGYLLSFSPKQTKGAQLVGNYLTQVTGLALPIIYLLAGAIVAGHTKKASMNAVLLMSFCLGNIFGPLTFRTEDELHL